MHSYILFSHKREIWSDTYGKFVQHLKCASLPIRSEGIVHYFLYTGYVMQSRFTLISIKKKHIKYYFIQKYKTKCITKLCKTET